MPPAQDGGHLVSRGLVRALPSTSAETPSGTTKEDVPANALPSGPCRSTSKYRRLSECGVAVIPGGESDTNRSVSCETSTGKAARRQPDLSNCLCGHSEVHDALRNTRWWVSVDVTYLEDSLRKASHGGMGPSRVGRGAAVGLWEGGDFG